MTAHCRPSWENAKSSPKRPRDGSWGWLCLGWRKELPSHMRLWGRQACHLAKKQLLPWQHASPPGKVPFRLAQVRRHFPSATTTADLPTARRNISQHPHSTSNGHKAERSQLLGRQARRGTWGSSHDLAPSQPWQRVQRRTGLYSSAWARDTRWRGRKHSWRGKAAADMPRLLLDLTHASRALCGVWEVFGWATGSSQH